MRRISGIILGLLLCGSLARAQGTDALLDTLQHTGFNYFWYEANPANGLIKDRSTPGSVCSIASTGFGLTSICVGIDHGWVTRSEGTDRVLTTLQTFWNGPQGSAIDGMIGYKGLYYHWLDMTTATRTWDSELSTIDTALLFAGILDARQYFNGADPREQQIRELADSIYFRADWEFMRNHNPGILMGWKPGVGGFAGFNQWIGYNEAMILYILALGSPTHPVTPNAWTAWTGGYVWQTNFGMSWVSCPPLFTHQYSQGWIDFRGIKDAYMTTKGSDYFENSRRATLVQRSYCKFNPSHWIGYGDSLWGITASDDKSGYLAHGALPLQSENGTLAPTAVVGSLPFAPEYALPCIRNMYNSYPLLWGTYGLKDAFNPTQGWYGQAYLGIDEGPIVIMIENYRTGRVWSRFMQDSRIRQGLIAAGFSGVTGVGHGPIEGSRAAELSQNTPNPFRRSSEIRYSLTRPGHVRLALFDMGGRQVRLLANQMEQAGSHQVSLRASGLPSGVYQYRLETGGTSLVKKCVLVQ